MNLQGKRVLLTGGSGFIGSHLCKRLVNEGAEVYVTTKYNSIIDNVRLVAWWNKVKAVEIDLRNPDSAAQIQDIKPHVIYHLAAYNHVGDSFLHVHESAHSNYIGTINLMEAYDGYESFIYTATSEIYGYQEGVPFKEEMTPFPMSPYALGKYAGELYARLQWKSLSRPVVVLRPFNAFGPYQSPRAIIAELIIKCLKGEDILTTGGKQTRDFNYVENLVDGFVLAAQNPEAQGEVINVGSGVEITIKDLVERIHTLSESKSDLKIGALSYRPGEIWRMYADSTKAKKLLGWESKIDLNKGLEMTIQWYRHYLSAFANTDSVLSQLSL